MESKAFTESGLTFNFSACENAYKADTKERNYNGLNSVDFIVEMPESVFLIEVKNLNNPEIPLEHIARQKEEFLSRHTSRDRSIRSMFQREILQKLKDTLLRSLAMGEWFSKPVIYILILEFNDLDYSQRRLLLEQISSNVPKFSESCFTSIHSVKFDLCDKEKYESYYGVSFA